ncbi:MAG: hypothetical protein KDA42_16565 [Planctomycetales bacterium]|nr:hypothetical protein [Planctomycetales bacterium]
MMTKFLWNSLVVTCCIACVGCSSDEPFDYIPVEGKITYEDGSLIPAQQIRLTFYSDAEAIDAKTHPLPGGTNVNVEDGTFKQVTSHKFGDGLIPGKHKVVVEALDENERPLPVVPREYLSQATTPLEADTANLPLELKVAKPK